MAANYCSNDTNPWFPASVMSMDRLTLEEEGSLFFRNVVNHLHRVAKSHPRKQKFLDDTTAKTSRLACENSSLTYVTVCDVL